MTRIELIQQQYEKLDTEMAEMAEKKRRLRIQNRIHDDHPITVVYSPTTPEIISILDGSHHVDISVDCIGQLSKILFSYVEELSGKEEEVL